MSININEKCRIKKEIKKDKLTISRVALFLSYICLLTFNFFFENWKVF
jgi:hypothetical protein